MPAKFTIRLICCAVVMVALSASTNFVTSQTKTFATPAGGAAQTVVNGDPATLTNNQSACVQDDCESIISTSPSGQYNWSSQVEHGGECHSPYNVVASTTHFFNNGSDTGSAESSATYQCTLVPE